jgi:ribosomal protein S18 acetylase RimI-like enzyme
MAVSLRKLGPGDESVLSVLAAEDADFDIDDRGGTLTPSSPEDQAAYLADPAVVHLVAEDGGRVVGHLYGHVLRKRTGHVEVLLYEIGVRGAYRRRGIGRALVDALSAWMSERRLVELWVVADNPGAVAFYGACGFSAGDPEDAVYMTRSRDAAERLAAPGGTAPHATRPKQSARKKT